MMLKSPSRLPLKLGPEELLQARMSWCVSQLVVRPAYLDLFSGASQIEVL